MNDEARPPRTRHRYIVGISLVAVLVACVGSGLIGWKVHTSTSSTIPKTTKAHFQIIALALANYSEVFGHLPFPVRRANGARPTDAGMPNGSGRTLYSWRAEIVPFLISWHGKWDPSAAWDSAANKQLIELSMFYCYDQSFSAGHVPSGHGRIFPDTNVLALTGPGTAFGENDQPPAALSDVPPDTIIAVESRDSAIPWPAPGDLDIRTIPAQINGTNHKSISSRCRDGFHVIFADGQVWFISTAVPFATLKKFFTVANARKFDREKLLRPFFVANE